MRYPIDALQNTLDSRYPSHDILTLLFLFTNNHFRHFHSQRSLSTSMTLCEAAVIDHLSVTAARSQFRPACHNISVPYTLPLLLYCIAHSDLACVRIITLHLITDIALLLAL